MTAASAIALYWAVLLIVVISLRRELGGRAIGGTTSRDADVRLLIALAVTVLATVVLTVHRLRSGG